MTQRAFDRHAWVQRLFPGAERRGRAAWAAGCRHERVVEIRITADDDVLAVSAGPLTFGGTAQDMAGINVRLPAASRVVLAAGGLHLLTERLLAAGTPIEELDSSVPREFQCALDLLNGAAAASDAGTGPPPAAETDAPAEHWKAVAAGDGNWSIWLPRGLGSLRASASVVEAELISAEGPEAEVRGAIAELLLRATSRLRCVKACCAQDDAATRWRAWLRTSSAVCGMDRALTATALACGECAAECRALADPRLARRYLEVSSAWPGNPSLEPSKERR